MMMVVVVMLNKKYIEIKLHLQTEKSRFFQFYQ